MNTAIRLMVVGALLAASGVALARQQVLNNGSFEAFNDVDAFQAEGWVEFGGFSERSIAVNLAPPGGEASVKAFGAGDETVSGVFQDVPILPGDVVEISGAALSRGSDFIGGDVVAVIRLEILDAGENVLDSAETTLLTPSSDADNWVADAAGPINAPAGAAVARFVCEWRFNNTSAGSAFWDDCMLLVNGSDELINGTFEQSKTIEEEVLLDWLGFGSRSRSELFAFEGAASAVNAVGTASFSGLFQNMVELEAGNRIVLLARGLNPSVDGVTQLSTVPGIKLEFSPPTGATTPDPVENLAFDETAPEDTWVPMSLATVVPDGVTKARVVLINFDESDVNGPVYAENALFERDSAPGVNQLLNDSFEDGPGGVGGLADWNEFRSLFSGAQKSAFEVPALDGINAAKFFGETAGLTQEVPVEPGETVTLTCQFRSRSVDPYADPNAQAGVKIEWVAGEVPPQIDIVGDTVQNNVYEVNVDPVDTWVPLTIDFTMPPGSAALTRAVTIIGFGGGLTENFYFDGFEAVVTNRFPDGADVDGDNDQDLVDVASFQTCFAPGSGLGYPCLVYDFDENDTINLTDFGTFEGGMTGPVAE